MKINKKKAVFWFVVFLILCTPLFMFLTWYFSPFKHMEILIVDKTVITEERDEHSALNWVLNYEKYSKINDTLYDKNTDYYGFFPKKNEKYLINDFENFSEKNIDSIVAKNDVFFYCDAYGVYTDEWYKQKFRNERSTKIYGGATLKEVMLLKKAKKSNKLIISEYNLLASPTPKKVRTAIENEFGFKWSGWVGRYYDVLDTLKNNELPNWLKKNYLKEHAKWPFKDAGIIFVREDGHIEILENKTHLTNENPMIYTTEKYQKEYNLPSKIKYNFWFDIIKTSSSNRVISNTVIATNRVGDSILSYYKIPDKFPAVIANKTDTFYYLAGDFSDNNVNENLNYFKGISYFKGLFVDDKDKTDREYFFWDFYKPLMTTIFDKEYTKTIYK